MIKIALFNHKGGVGKTTLTVNIANAFEESNFKTLIVDADPQCNITSFYLEEASLERMLADSADDGAESTLWSAVKPVAEGRGGIAPVTEWRIGNEDNPGTTHLLPGDVMLSEYEELLPEAWTECFARRTRGYDVTTALAQVVNAAGDRVGADICLYDVGPNVGALNRAVLLDCDYFVTPVAADLFSLRALTTVGRAMAKWVTDWKTIKALASPADQARIFSGETKYLGYITSAFKVNSGRNAANPHADWEAKIAPRVRDRIIKVLEAADPALTPSFGGNKLGSVKHYHSLAPSAQKVGLAIGALRGHVNSGHYGQVDDAQQTFASLAAEIVRRAGITR